jgi:hypothetical protein
MTNPDSAAAATGGFEASSLARDLRDFAGPNAETLLRKMRGWLGLADDPENAAKQSRHRGGLASIVWPALVLSFIWFFWRRMYIEGMLFIVLPFAIAALLVGAGGTILPVVPLINGVLAAALGGFFYLYRARRRIAAADAQGLAGDDRRTFLAAGGGTSWAGLAIGIAVYAVPILGVAFRHL